MALFRGENRVVLFKTKEGKQKHEKHQQTKEKQKHIIGGCRTKWARKQEAKQKQNKAYDYKKQDNKQDS